MSNQVLITQKLLDSCENSIFQKFSATRLYEQKDPAAFLLANGKFFNAIAGSAVDAPLMDKLPSLKLIANFGVGYDAIDVRGARARNISVTNTPDVLNDAMAEMAIGMMIALSRKIISADSFVRKGKWVDGNFPLQSELKGKTAAIVGLGRIGKEIALLCRALKMEIIYFGRNRQSAQPYEYFADLVEMSRKADWLIIATPGGEETRGLINTDVLDALGEDGFLVNIARGSIVDEAALVKKLLAAELAGAALDVFASEPKVPLALFGLDNVVLSPHQGSATKETRFAMGQLLVTNLEAFFDKKPLLTPLY